MEALSQNFYTFKDPEAIFHNVLKSLWTIKLILKDYFFFLAEQSDKNKEEEKKTGVSVSLIAIMTPLKRKRQPRVTSDGWAQA